jgi:hypothetical protein
MKTKRLGGLIEIIGSLKFDPHNKEELPKKRTVLAKTKHGHVRWTGGQQKRQKGRPSTEQQRDTQATKSPKGKRHRKRKKDEKTKDTETGKKPEKTKEQEKLNNKHMRNTAREALERKLRQKEKQETNDYDKEKQEKGNLWSDFEAR